MQRFHARSGLFKQGNVLIFEQFPAVVALKDHARQQVIQKFRERVKSVLEMGLPQLDSYRPKQFVGNIYHQSIYTLLDKERLILIQDFEKDGKTKKLFCDMVQEILQYDDGSTPPNKHSDHSSDHPGVLRFDPKNNNSSRSSNSSRSTTTKDGIYWDRPRVRIQLPRFVVSKIGGDVESEERYPNIIDDVSDTIRFGKGRFSSTLPLHRDTWANNLQEQVNWWLLVEPVLHGDHTSIYSSSTKQQDHERCRRDVTPMKDVLNVLTPQGTLSIYLDKFLDEVPNDSEGWNFEELKKKRKKGDSYPQMPVFTPDDRWSSEKISKILGYPLHMKSDILNPGDVILFSGAHLHGSVVNEIMLSEENVNAYADSVEHLTNLIVSTTRVSLETRTVCTGDDKAVNVDGKTGRRITDWFQSITDEKKKYK